jgi:hypothetical protein
LPVAWCLVLGDDFTIVLLCFLPLLTHRTLDAHVLPSSYGPSVRLVQDR